MVVSVPETRLGVDLGTSNTVAVLSRPGRAPVPLLFDGSPVLPSAVFASGDRLLVGRDAERAAMSDPAAFEPNPKRNVGDETVLLGGKEFAVTTVLSAILDRVAAETVRVLGGTPAELVLTHPAAWGSHRRAVLATAAMAAGLPAPKLLAEPVAAASHYRVQLGHRLTTGDHVVIYDLGGGTFDVTAVRVDGDRIEVAATGGLPDLGGVDIDYAVVRHLETTYPGQDEQWRRLREPVEAADRRHRRGLWRDVRDAKELLSRESSAALFVPVLDVDAHLTRDELEQLARPLLEQTVDLTLGVLDRAGIGMDAVTGLFLVGGASRMPLASTLLLRKTSKAPTVLEQPELVVASGAISAADIAVPAGEQVAAVPVHVPPRPVYRGVARVPAPRPAPTAATPQPASGTGPVWRPPYSGPIPVVPGQVWNAPYRESGDAPLFGAAAVRSLAVRGERFAVATGLRLAVCRLSDGDLVSVSPPHPAPPTAVSWSPDGDGVAVAEGSSVVVWPIAESGEIGASPARVIGCPADVATVDWSVGGLAVGTDTEVLVWDAATGECRRTRRFSGRLPDSSRLRSLAWSPDGSRLAVAGTHGDIKIWDGDADAASMVLGWSPVGVRSLAWSPDQEWLLAGDAAGGIRIWRLSDRSQQPVETTHDAAVQTVAWSPDGKLLASGSIDHTVRLWDAGSGRPRGTLAGHEATVSCLGWGDDGHRLMSGDTRGGVRAWDVDNGTVDYRLPVG